MRWCKVRARCTASASCSSAEAASSGTQRLAQKLDCACGKSQLFHTTLCFIELTLFARWWFCLGFWLILSLTLNLTKEKQSICGEINSLIYSSKSNMALPEQNQSSLHLRSWHHKSIEWRFFLATDITTTFLKCCNMKSIIRRIDELVKTWRRFDECKVTSTWQEILFNKSLPN